MRTKADVLNVYSPANLGYVVKNPDDAYTCQCPVLSDLRHFGNDLPGHWIRVQVTAIFLASASRDAGMADAIKLFAETFAEQVGGYKLTELMLFFARYRSGRYDESFSTFDPKRIGSCFFREFRRERDYELDHIERKQRQKELEQRRFTPPNGKSSWELYQETKRKAAEGDKEAQKLLKGPCG